MKITQDKSYLYRLFLTVVMVFGLLFSTGGLVEADDSLPPVESEPQSEEDLNLGNEIIPFVVGEVEGVKPAVLEEAALELELEDPSDTGFDADASTPENLELQSPSVQSEIAQVVEILNEQGKSLVGIDGEPVFMGSQEAEEIFLNKDPFFWNGTTWVGYTVSGTGCPTNVVCLSDPFPFQAAVSAAPANSTIYVASGTYEEDVVVNTANLSFSAFHSITVPTTAATLIPDVPGFALLRSLTLNVDFGLTSGVYATHVIVNEPGKTGGRVADALNLVDRSDADATIDANMTIISSALDAKGSGDNYYRVQDTNDATTHFEWDCSEPQITINVNQSYRMTLMNPSNPLIANYFSVERGNAVSPRSPDSTIEQAQALVEDLVLAANMSEQTVGGFVPWRNMDEKLIYWNLLGHVGNDSSGNSISLNTVDPDGTGPKQNQKAIYDYIKSGLNDSTIAELLDVWFLWPRSLGNTTKSPFNTQLTFLKLVSPTITGCSDPDALNYNPNADGQGECEYPPVVGCMDPTALNYNPLAAVPAECDYPPVVGCMDPTALNYNPLAAVPAECDYPPVVGCMDPTALNYNPLAAVPTECDYPPVVGCMDPTALNYNPFAAVSGECDYPEIPDVPEEPEVPEPPLLANFGFQAVIPVTGGRPIIVAGLSHTCMTIGNEVACWGLNDSGQVGNGNFIQQVIPNYVLDLQNVIDLTAGSLHTCALTADGEIWCWGENSSGQLGNNSTEDSNSPVFVDGLPGKVIDFTAGNDFTCAQIENTEIWCWGNNQSGQLNDGTTISHHKPVRSLLAGNLSLISGGQKVLASESTGDVSTWKNVELELVDNVSLPQEISANRWATGGCVSTVSGSVKCWHDDLTSAQVEGINSSILVETGFKHSCSINGDLTVSCWGENLTGQLGNGTTSSSEAVVTNPYLDTIQDLALGEYHTCVLAGEDYSAFCWGKNTNGQLGINSMTDNSIPVKVHPPIRSSDF